MENVNGSYITERVAVLENENENHEKELERHDKRIEKLEDNNKTLHELVANNKSLTELVKESHEVHKETRQTLSEINTNITTLNFGQKQMQEELIMVKDEMSTTNSRISEVEKKTEDSNDKGKFDVIDFISKDLPKAIGLALIGAFLAYLGLK